MVNFTILSLNVEIKSEGGYFMTLQYFWQIMDERSSAIPLYQKFRPYIEVILSTNALVKKQNSVAQ